ncbi:tetraspanin-18-like [Mytilus californianus]|uniref:tetraspanin-18-like n=1 Tax=Mytilus californianus TaxID=6549 RepID=UPI002247D650|nr:tetraspanin-18-like [Mytilus californianus]XP_052060369.1 tetraspanin-18-like [Mytilus californianus]
MGIITSIGRCLVTLLNIFFLIVSLVLTAAGVIAFYASDISFIKTVEEKVREALKSMASATNSSTDGINDFSITEFMDGIGMALIISGCFLLILSFFGCCGASCKFRTLIFIYALIITVLLLAEIIVVIVLYAAPDTIKGSIKDGLLESLKGYKGIGSSDASTLGWLFVMQEMKCCGVNGYEDFGYTHTDDWKTPGGVTDPLTAPLVCCIAEPAGFTMTATACARSGTLAINTQGCFDAVWNQILGNTKLAVIVYVVAFLFQSLLIIFSYLMYVDGKKKGNKVYPKA